MKSEPSKTGIEHIEEGDLLRLVDLEMGEIERRDVEGHLAECIHCRIRRDRLSHMSVQVSRALRTIDPDVRTPARLAARRRTAGVPAWMRVAASVVLVAALGVAFAPPLRAWIGSQAAVVAEWARGPTEVAPEPEPAVVMHEAPERSRVAFPVQDARFRILFERPPRGGELVLARQAGDHAAVEIRGGDGREEVIVLSGEVQIRASAASSAGYRIEVPLTISEVELTIPGEGTRVWRPDDLTEDSVRVVVGDR